VGHAGLSRGLPWGRTGLVLGARSSVAAAGAGIGRARAAPALALLR
jgi:hypothetical protein